MGFFKRPSCEQVELRSGEVVEHWVVERWVVERWLVEQWVVEWWVVERGVVERWVLKWQQPHPITRPGKLN
jgi:hypothetical protein